MPRVKRGNKRRLSRKKVLKAAKGYYGMKSRCYRVAREAVDRARAFATRDRRVRKREFRKLWIIRIGAAARQCGTSYSRLIAGMKAAGIEIDRKNLADIAVHDMETFAKVVKTASAALQDAA